MYNLNSIKYRATRQDCLDDYKHERIKNSLRIVYRRNNIKLQLSNLQIPSMLNKKIYRDNFKRNKICGRKFIDYKNIINTNTRFISKFEKEMIFKLMNKVRNICNNKY